MKVIADYDYTYNVIENDYDYIASGNYDYWRSCNRLQSITITDYDYPNPDCTHAHAHTHTIIIIYPSAPY